MKYVPIALLLVGIITSPVHAQKNKKFHIGQRSTMVLGSMNLSEIDPAFDDLTAKGGLGDGVHHSSVYFLYQIRPNLKVGFETLVGNSSEHEKTSMDFQAAGAVVEWTYGRSVFVAGGAQMGAMIVDALSRDDAYADERVAKGTFFKGGGPFIAPYVGIGKYFGAWEARLMLKSVFVGQVEDDAPMDAFSAHYAGISVGYRF